VRGWDCGPANTLLDLAVQQFSGGSQSHDAGGTWALSGQVQEALVKRWLQEPYLQQPPPKSTGRELFGRPDLQRRLAELETISRNPADALATLAAFSAAAVAQDLARGPRPIELLVAGGGARNGALMQQLRWRCTGMAVRPLEELGIVDSQREALAFALLAWWHWRGVPGSAPSVTGAERAAVLGVCARP
jgi:anhydro-N-acetylmuramic acid kinase